MRQVQKEAHGLDQDVQIALVCEVTANAGGFVISALLVLRCIAADAYLPSIRGWSYGSTVRRRTVPELDGLSRREP